MKIHEYQARAILARYGVPVQPGRVASTAEEAEAIARELGGPVVIKAQVYVGGRGKAGGIQFGETPEQACAAAARVLGMEIKGHHQNRRRMPRGFSPGEECGVPFIGEQQLPKYQIHPQKNLFPNVFYEGRGW